MGFIDTIKARAKADKKTIVLPESEDRRTYEAAAQILKEDLANLIIIGSEEAVKKGSEGLDVSKATIVDPEKNEKTQAYVDKLVELIEKQKQEKEQQEKVIAEKQKELDGADVSFNEWDSLRMQIPTWKDVFLNADNPTKRVLVNKLIEKISVKEDEVVIRFKININEIRSKALKKSESIVPENKLEDKSVILDSLKIYPKK